MQEINYSTTKQSPHYQTINGKQNTPREPIKLIITQKNAIKN